MLLPFTAPTDAPVTPPAAAPYSNPMGLRVTRAPTTAPKKLPMMPPFNAPICVLSMVAQPLVNIKSPVSQFEYLMIGLLSVQPAIQERLLPAGAMKARDHHLS